MAPRTGVDDDARNRPRPGSTDDGISRMVPLEAVSIRTNGPVMGSTESRTATHRIALAAARARVLAEEKVTHHLESAVPSAPSARNPTATPSTSGSTTGLHASGRPSNSKLQSMRSKSGIPPAELPRYIQELPPALRYDPLTFAAAVRNMPSHEKDVLRREINREQLFVRRGRYSQKGARAIRTQAIYLLSVLDGRSMEPPKPPKVSSPKAKNRQPLPQRRWPLPRLRDMDSAKPVPTKYSYPAQGRPVSGGLPSLGRRG